MRKSLFFVVSVTSAVAVFAGTEVLIHHPPAGSARANFTRSLTCYVSDALADQHDAGCLASSEASLNLSKLPETAMPRLAEIIDTSTHEVSPQGLMSWWNEWAYASVSTRHQRRWIKTELSEVKRALPYKSWPKEVIEFSPVKRKTRVIYRSPSGFEAGVSVAETLESETGDLSAPIRETEIAIDRTDGTGNSDFYAYDREGHLSSVSTFPSGERAVPSMCLSCHHSIITNTFGRQDI